MSWTPTTPDSPDFMKCSLCLLLMEDPVLALDGMTYERSKIMEWFESGHHESPVTKAPMLNALMDNDRLKQAIQQWVEDNNSKDAQQQAQQQMDRLKLDIFSVTAADMAWSIVQQSLNLVATSEYLLLSPIEANSFKGLLGCVVLNLCHCFFNLCCCFVNLCCFFVCGLRPDRWVG